MDDTVSITNRKVKTQFEVDRFSDQTLAIAYQQLLPSLEQNAPLENTFLGFSNPALPSHLTAEATP